MAPAGACRLRALRDDQGSADDVGPRPIARREADAAQSRRLRARRLDDAAVPVRAGNQRAILRRLHCFYHGVDCRYAWTDPDGARFVRSGEHRHAACVGTAVRGRPFSDLAVSRLHAVGSADPGHVRRPETAEKEKALTLADDAVLHPVGIASDDFLDVPALDAWHFIAVQ